MLDAAIRERVRTIIDRLHWVVAGKSVFEALSRIPRAQNQPAAHHRFVRQGNRAMG